MSERHEVSSLAERRAREQRLDPEDYAGAQEDERLEEHMTTREQRIEKGARDLRTVAVPCDIHDYEVVLVCKACGHTAEPI